MANFCRDCSIAMFGRDFGDLAGISTEKDTAEGRYARTLCEGCGYVLVDHDGIVVEKLGSPRSPRLKLSALGTPPSPPANPSPSSCRTSYDLPPLHPLLPTGSRQPLLQRRWLSLYWGAPTGERHYGSHPHQLPR